MNPQSINLNTQNFVNDPQRRTPIILTAAVVVAILLRLALALIHPFSFPDSVDYDGLARALIHGLPYEIHGLLATRIPGFPLLVAAIYALCGPSVKAILIFQAFLGGASTALVYLFARPISIPIALLAAWLAAIDPLSIGFSAALLSEAIFTFLLIASICMLARVTETRRISDWVLSGLLWSAAVYMRASAVWLILPLAFCASGSVHFSPPLFRPNSWRGPAISIAIVLIALLPWQFRNYAIFHDHFFRLTTLEGISLYEAVYPDADGGPKQDIIPLPPEMHAMNESQRNDEWARRAHAFIWSDPFRIAALAFRKAARTWSPWMNASDFQSPLVQSVMILWHIPLFIFALIGLAGRALSRKMKAMLLIPILYFTAVHALFLGSVRYRVPLMPLVCILAAAGITSTISHVRTKRAPAATV